MLPTGQRKWYNTLMPQGQTPHKEADKDAIDPASESVIAAEPPKNFKPEVIQPPVSPVDQSPTPGPTIPDAPWVVTDMGTPAQSGYGQASNQEITWSASEFIAHQKNVGWFAGLGFVISVVAIGVFILSKDFVSSFMIVVLGLAFGVFAARKPRVLDYTISSKGITMGQKFYPYESFKTFSVVEEGPLHSVLLSPLQRFMPPISVYYEPADEDRILDTLADYLPFIEAKRDSVDSLMRRVRF